MHRRRREGGPVREAAAAHQPRPAVPADQPPRAVGARAATTRPTPSTARYIVHWRDLLTCRCRTFGVFALSYAYHMTEDLAVEATAGYHPPDLTWAGPSWSARSPCCEGQPRRQLMFDADLVWSLAHAKLRLGGSITHFDFYVDRRGRGRRLGAVQRHRGKRRLRSEVLPWARVRPPSGRARPRVPAAAPGGDTARQRRHRDGRVQHLPADEGMTCAS